VDEGWLSTRNSQTVDYKISLRKDNRHKLTQCITISSDYSNDYVHGDFLAIEIILCIQWLRLKGGYVSSTVVHHV
jgi:hypothetical protein